MKTKRVLMYLAIAFVIFYLYSRPTDAATTVKGLVNGLGSGAGQLAQFFTRLLA